MNTLRKRINSLAWNKSGRLFLKIALVLLCGVFIWSKWYEQRPLEVHLSDIFEESGFHVPASVSSVEGEKGFVDFFGDYSASISFVVSPEQIDSFMYLPAKFWKDPSAFKAIEGDAYCGKFKIPAGSYLIEEWTTGYYSRYAVDRLANRIYFYRSST